jgi:uncharacterized cupredoxin-like copper-binding protein
VLVVPLAVFTGIRNGWFESEAALGPRDVRVELSNFQIDTSRSTIEAGETTLVVEHKKEIGHASGNEPGETHDLVVFRMVDGAPTSVVARSRVLMSGESESLRVDLAAGTYELECDIAEEWDGHAISHAAEGMVASLTVTAPAAVSAR